MVMSPETLRRVDQLVRRRRMDELDRSGLLTSNRSTVVEELVRSGLTMSSNVTEGS